MQLNSSFKGKCECDEEYAVKSISDRNPTMNEPEFTVNVPPQPPMDMDTHTDTPANNDDLATARQVKGAAVAGGIAGCLLAGPVGGLVAAGGAAAVAVAAKGPAGNMARKSGDAMANAGVSIKRFDKKHQVSKKTKDGITKSASWVSQRAVAGDVTRKSATVMGDAGDRLKRFDETHQVRQKTADGITKSANWVSMKLLNPKPVHSASPSASCST